DINVNLLSPKDYVEVSAISYDPTANRLEARIKAKPLFAGPPCKVTLDLRPERIPGLIPTARKEGNYSDLVQKGKDGFLVAGNLQFRPGPAVNGLVYITVDGYERAFIYKTTFDRLAATRFQPELALGPPPTLPLDVISPYTPPT